MTDSYDKIDRFLRNNLDDADYAEYSAALDSVLAQRTEKAAPVAWAIFTPEGNIRMWSTVSLDVGAVATKLGATLTPLFAAPPSSPAPTGEALSERAEFELWQINDDEDMFLAGTDGPREQAMAEIMRYASQYAQDGRVKVLEVKRIEVKP